METERPPGEVEGPADVEVPSSALFTRAAETPGDVRARAYVAIGSNEGDRLRAMRASIDALGQLPGVSLAGLSRVYETEAHVLPGQPPQPAFLNAVAAVETGLAPGDLLRALLHVEKTIGRTRDGSRWQPRAIDLDLILYGDRVVHEAGLTVPHPRLVERRFVLQPLAELAADTTVPGTGRTVAELLADCPDQAAVERTDLRLQ